MRETTEKSDSETGHTIHFRVVEGVSRRPVSGAVLQLASFEEEREYATDEEGGCAIVIGPPLPEGVMVRVRKPGFVPVCVSWNLDESARLLPEDYTVVLEAGNSIGGIVRDEEDAPVEGVTVYLVIWSRKMENGAQVSTDIHDCTAVTDKEGRWHFDEAPADLTGLMYRLKHHEFVEEMRYTRAEMPVEKFRDGTVVMAMKRGVCITGIVADGEGRPVADAEILPGQDRFCSGTKPSYRSDGEGRFRIIFTPNKRESLTVKAKGFAPALVEFDADEFLEPLKIVMEPGRKLRGRVVNMAGEPLAGTLVCADTWRECRSLETRFKTDGEGRFQWEDAPGDEVFFDILQRGYRSVRRTPLTASDEEHVLVLRRPLMLRGTVKDARTGKPVEQFSLIHGQRQRGRIYWSRENAVAFSGGVYERAYKGDIGREAEKLVRVEAEGYLSKTASIDETAEERTIDFVLEPGAALGGRVLTPEGSGAAGAKVAVVFGSSAWIEGKRLKAGHGNIEIAADAEGRFAIPSQEPPYALVAMHETGCAIATADEFAGNPVLQLKGWGRVEIATESGAGTGGKIPFYIHFENIRQDADKMPWVSFRHEPTRTAENRIVFENLPPGKAWLGRYGQTDRNAMALFIEAGKTTTLDFERRTVAGPCDPEAALVKIIDEEGKPVEGAKIEAWSFGLKGHGGTMMRWSSGDGEEEPMTTNGDGVASISYPKTGVMGMPGKEVDSVNVIVRHPDFCTARAECAIDGESLPVVLKRGATLVVSGAFEDRTTSAARIYAETCAGDYSEEPDRDAWVAGNGNTLTHTQVPDGRRLLRLVAFPENDVTHFSDVMNVELETRGRKEVKALLRRGTRFAGRLDDAVPRPILKGEVEVNVTTVCEGTTHSIEWRTWTDIQPDGTFVFESLPEGRVELVAICDGFASKNEGGNADPGRTPQIFHIGKEGALVKVEMERTATCKAHVTDDQGKALAGAGVYLSPNVRWASGGSGIFAGAGTKQEESMVADRKTHVKRMRERTRAFHYRGVADESGVAVIPNLPRGRHPFGAHFQGYQMISPAGQMGHRFRQVEFQAGKVKKVDVTMRVVDEGLK